MRRLVCQEENFDEGTGTCLVEEWAVDEPAWLHMLPSVEDATVIGGGMFLAVCAVLAAGLLFPPRGSDDD